MEWNGIEWKGKWWYQTKDFSQFGQMEQEVFEMLFVG